MPNLPQQQTIVQYITNSSQTQYTFAFYAPLNTDIQVYYQASNATPIPATDILVLSVGYTVTYNADPTTGGYITLLFTPTTGYYLTINRQVMASLNTNFANAQNFNGANLDTALDRLLLLCQQNQNYNLQRNLSYVINTYLPNATPYTQLPPLAQNQFWIGSGSGITAGIISQVPSASVLQALLASVVPSADGGSIVGYYDAVSSNPTTVSDFLSDLNSLISSNITYGNRISLTTGTSQNITNITITPGTWRLYGNVYFTPAGTMSNAVGWINTISATFPDYSQVSSINISDPTGALGFPVPTQRITVATNTVIYLSCNTSFTSTATACGNLYAEAISLIT